MTALLLFIGAKLGASSVYAVTENIHNVNADRTSPGAAAFLLASTVEEAYAVPGA